MPTQELSGTTALVTGASRGFGRAIAVALSKHGAHVAGVARDPGRLEELHAQLGGTFTPHCAAIHPARLARGLARAVERHGVRVYERTPVTAIRPGMARTPTGMVRAPIVIRATGYRFASTAWS